jgi:hypothetical protein
MRRASVLCLVRRIWNAGICGGEWTVRRRMMMRRRRRILKRKKKKRSESGVSRARRTRMRGGGLVKIGLEV